mmetsp:Transcript_4459/g.14721  ORF Transcript_4459/g.14721 Transcript_4459/m.14721 type:complete len:165 (+) Transcript_4459:1053-1547(+)
MRKLSLALSNVSVGVEAGSSAGPNHARACAVFSRNSSSYDAGLMSTSSLAVHGVARNARRAREEVGTARPRSKAREDARRVVSDNGGMATRDSKCVRRVVYRVVWRYARYVVYRRVMCAAHRRVDECEVVVDALQKVLPDGCAFVYYFMPTASSSRVHVIGDGF